MFRKISGIIVLESILYLFVCAQNAPLSKNILIQQDYSEMLNEWNIRYPSESFHSVYQPYLTAGITSFADSVFQKKSYPKIQSLFLSKTFNDAPNKRNQYQLQILPVLHSIQGFDGTPTSENGIGTQIYLNINNDFTLYGLGTMYSSVFPYFLDTSVYSTQFIRNIGFPLSVRSSKYAYLYWSAYASYTKSYFNFQLGNGKMFVGDGYRSLLLSDIAPAYPYFKGQVNFWKLQYNVYYLLLSHYNPGSALNSIQKKYSTMHTLSFNLNKNFNITLFENVVWQGTDTNRHRGFDPVYLSPVVFLRPQEFQQGSSDNVMMGLNAHYILSKKAKVYGQLALDEFYLKEIRAGKGWWANKQAWQFGVYVIDALGIKNLNMRLEYNEAKPYTYSHGAPAQNYSHAGSPLAHPFGANFREFVGQLNFSFRKWQIRFHQVYAEVGKDSISSFSNVGQNIFLSYTTHPKEYGNYTLQGIRTYFNHTQLEVSYLLIPVMNMRVQTGLAYRAQNEVLFKYSNLWFYAGITCSVFNFYRNY